MHTSAYIFSNGECYHLINRYLTAVSVLDWLDPVRLMSSKVFELHAPTLALDELYDLGEVVVRLARYVVDEFHLLCNTTLVEPILALLRDLAKRLC
jgi:hypothetical protein